MSKTTHKENNKQILIDTYSRRKAFTISHEGDAEKPTWKTKHLRTKYASKNEVNTRNLSSPRAKVARNTTTAARSAGLERPIVCKPLPRQPRTQRPHPSPWERGRLSLLIGCRRLSSALSARAIVARFRFFFGFVFGCCRLLRRRVRGHNGKWRSFSSPSSSPPHSLARLGSVHWILDF